MHGSHRAPGPANGLIRGAYDIVGSATLPAPIGNVWMIPTNKGEWHLLTERGFYLSHLFQSDPMKWNWPEPAIPGAVLDQVPPGAGEESFGGSMTMGVDGKLYVQCGHTSFWNAEVTGLDTVKSLPESGSVTIEQSDLATSQACYAQLLQASSGTKQLAISPTFTGDIAKDFAGAELLNYQKHPACAVQTAAAWDERMLYAGWTVKDDSPWINGADAPENLYARGDSVDLQLATDPHANKTRKAAGPGDLRLSIGNFQGKPTAVLYRPVADDKRPKTFSSGVVKAYTVDSVTVLSNANIQVKVDKLKGQYIVEAAIPLTDLGLQPVPGLKLAADFGVTHSDKAGGDTILRSCWNNQDTGLVSDEVFELQLVPANWGELIFR